MGNSTDSQNSNSRLSNIKFNENEVGTMVISPNDNIQYKQQLLKIKKIKVLVIERLKNSQMKDLELFFQEIQKYTPLEKLVVDFGDEEELNNLIMEKLIKFQTNLLSLYVNGEMNKLSADKILEFLSKQNIKKIMLNLKAKSKKCYFKELLSSSKLVELFITHGFNKMDLYRIMEGLHTNKSLLKLGFTYLNFKNLQIVGNLSKGFEINSSLNELNFSFCVIDDSFDKMISKGLRKNTSINKITFIGNSIYGNSMNHFFDMLSENRSINSLLCVNNQIPQQSAKKFAESIKYSSIKELIIKYENNVIECKVLENLFQSNTTLEILKLGVHSSNLKKTFQSVNKHPKLRKLELDVVDLDETMSFLIGNKQINDLYIIFREQKFPKDYIISLKDNITLKRLSIENFYDELEEDLLLLFKYLRENQSVKYLSIIGENAPKGLLKEVSYFLNANRLLKEFKFSINLWEIDYEELNLFNESIVYHQTLRSLVLNFRSLPIESYFPKLGLNFVLTHLNLPFKKGIIFDIPERNKQVKKISRLKFNMNNGDILIHLR